MSSVFLSVRLFSLSSSSFVSVLFCSLSSLFVLVCVIFLFDILFLFFLTCAVVMKSLFGGSVGFGVVSAVFCVLSFVLFLFFCHVSVLVFSSFSVF